MFNLYKILRLPKPHVLKLQVKYILLLLTDNAIYDKLKTVD